MQAEIISVGTELLLGDTIDTNAAYISRALSELGIDLKRRVTVGDNEERIIRAVREALSRADIAITIGGLGPTEDDITKEACSAAIGVSLLPDEESAEYIRNYFKKRKIKLPERNLKQAVRPESGRIIPNDVGTAPGAIFEKDGKVVICLPGPPFELIPMFENTVKPYLREIQGPSAKMIVSQTLKLCGIGESQAEELIRDIIHSDNPTVAPYAKMGEVHLRITAKVSNEAEAKELISGMQSKLMERIGEYVFGVNDTTLEQAVVNLMAAKKLTLGTAESCTGGLVSNRITNVPGSSEVFLGGIVAYSNAIKNSLLAVPEAILAEYGAVSAPVAAEMAEGARNALGSHIGIGITGIAGPSGGTKEKPVGLVYMSISHAGEETPEVREHHFNGSRVDIKTRAAQAALTMLWEFLKR